MEKPIHSQSETKKRFVQAACVYAGCKLALSILIFLYLCDSCADFNRYMFYTTFRVLLITIFIFVGFRISAKIIAVTNACRAVLYLFGFFASTATFQVTFLGTSFSPFYDDPGNPALLVSAALAGTVAFFLARAGWSPVPVQRRGATPVPQERPIAWTDEALKRVRPVPFFLKRLIEKRARKMGIETITLEALDEIKGF